MEILSFTHKEIVELMQEAATKALWDFSTALGDTIKEKYESLYVKAIELNAIMLTKGAEGYFWIIASPEVASIFETATVGFSPISSEMYESYYKKFDKQSDEPVQYQTSKKNYDNPPLYVGSINYRWKLYKSNSIAPEEVLIGVGTKKLPPENYAFLKIANFVI